MPTTPIMPRFARYTTTTRRPGSCPGRFFQRSTIWLRTSWEVRLRRRGTRTWPTAPSRLSGAATDLVAVERLHKRYRALGLGLVDAVVLATAERLKAEAIATLDLRHFGAVAIKGSPRLLPRDWR
jgi:predicted nucleic acid-binding protein